MEEIPKKNNWRLWVFILIILGLGYNFIVSESLQKLKTLLNPQTSSETLSQVSSFSSQPKKRISALGRLEPKGEIIELAASEKDLVAKLLIKEGDKVEEGQELVRLNNYSERLAEINQLTAQLEEAKTQLEAETQFGLNQIQENEVRLKRLEEISPLQISSQEAEVRKLKAEFKNAKLELIRLKKLKKSKTVSQQQLDRQVLEFATSQERLKAAIVRLEELNKSKVLDIELAKSELETSEAELIKLQSAIGIRSLETELEVTQSRFERTIIRAPIKGEVLEIVTWEGEMADNEPILKLGDTREMYAVAEVYESDVQWIELGQQASISSPAFPEAITGIVERIGRLVSKNDVLDVDPASDKDARVVEVKVKLDRSDAVSGLSNMQVDVMIDL